MAAITGSMNYVRLIGGGLLALFLCCCAATLPACDDKAGAGVAKVKVGGKSFYLETALDGNTRMRGLSDRAHIDPTGGMLFVFPEEHFPQGSGFVMRDCPVDIDIIYLNSSGRVVSQFEMKPEPPRGPDEGEHWPGSQKPTDANQKYEKRLHQYVSRQPYQFVVELAGGTLKTLNVKDGDVVEFDAKGLVKKAQ